VIEGVIEPLAKALPSMSSSPPDSESRKLSVAAFEALFLATYPRLVSLLRRMLGDSGRAEEIANEAFLKLHSTALPPAARENIAGWVYRTAMNLGIDDLRARARHAQVSREAFTATSSTTHPDDGLQNLLRQEKQRRVRVALSRLRPEWSQILLLRASGYSYKEIAAHLDIAITSVGTLLVRAEAGFEKCYLALFGEKD